MAYKFQVYKDKAGEYRSAWTARRCSLPKATRPRRRPWAPSPRSRRTRRPPRSRKRP